MKLFKSKKGQIIVIPVIAAVILAVAVFALFGGVAWTIVSNSQLIAVIIGVAIAIYFFKVAK